MRRRTQRPRGPVRPTAVRAATAALLAAPLLAGCVSRVPGEPAPGFVVRDSAGIVVMENHAAAWGEQPALRVSPEPRARFGPFPEGAWRTLDAVRLGDGAVVVADGLGGRLGWYDSIGAPPRWVPLAPAAAPAASPLTLIRTPGDTVALYLAGPEQVLRYDGQGNFLDVTLLEAEDVLRRDARGANAGLLGRLDSGDYLFLLQRTPDVSGPVRLDARLARRSADGHAAPALVRFTGGSGVREMQRIPALEGDSLVLEPVLAFATILGDRQAAAATDGERIWYGAGDRYRLHQADADGRVRRVVLRPGAPVPINDSTVELLAHRLLRPPRHMAGRYSRDEWRRRARPLIAELRESMRRLPFATFPAYLEMRTDPAGRLWVRTLDLDVPDAWDVFDGVGRWLGTVPVPVGRTLEIGDDYVLAVAPGPDRRSWVTLHPLERVTRH